MITKDDLKTDYYIGNNGKLETPQQHQYYIWWQMMGFVVDKNPQKLRNYVLKLQEQNIKDKNNQTAQFPYKKVLSVPQIYKMMHNFDWKLRDADRSYEESLEVQDDINEYNRHMIKEEMKQNQSLNNALTSLQNVMTTLIINLNQQNESLINSLKQVTWIYNTLTRLKEDRTIHINTIGLNIKDWVTIKEEIIAHHNELNTNPDNLENQFASINYFFDNYLEDESIEDDNSESNNDENTEQSTETLDGQ